MRQNSIYLTLLQSIHFVFFFLPLIVEAMWDRVGWFTFPPGLATRDHCHLLLFQKTAQDLGYVWCPRTSAGDFTTAPAASDALKLSQTTPSPTTIVPLHAPTLVLITASIPGPECLWRLTILCWESPSSSWRGLHAYPWFPLLTQAVPFPVSFPCLSFQFF